MALDETVRAHLKELGNALNEAVSSSSRVHEILARLREADYHAHLVLDATVALEKRGKQAKASLPSIRRGGLPKAHEGREGREVPFVINVKDLGFLKSVGIDPTRPGRSRQRPGHAVRLRSTVSRRG